MKNSLSVDNYWEEDEVPSWQIFENDLDNEDIDLPKQLSTKYSKNSFKSILNEVGIKNREHGLKNAFKGIYDEELTFVEIGKCLNISAAMAEHIFHKSLKKLRQPICWKYYQELYCEIKDIGNDLLQPEDSVELCSIYELLEDKYDELQLTDNPYGLLNTPSYR